MPGWRCFFRVSHDISAVGAAALGVPSLHRGPSHAARDRVGTLADFGVGWIEATQVTPVDRPQKLRLAMASYRRSGRFSGPE